MESSAKTFLLALAVVCLALAVQLSSSSPIVRANKEEVKLRLPTPNLVRDLKTLVDVANLFSPVTLSRRNDGDIRLQLKPVLPMAIRTLGTMINGASEIMRVAAQAPMDHLLTRLATNGK